MKIQRVAASLLVILLTTVSSRAQPTIKILTPMDDTCATFMAAMNSRDSVKTVALGGWALGYLSGVAQGTGVDILHGATAKGVMNRLYSACQRQPSGAMSLVLEKMSRSLVTERDGNGGQ